MSHYTPKDVTPLPWELAENLEAHNPRIEIFGQCPDFPDDALLITDLTLSHSDEEHNAEMRANARYFVHAANEYPQAIDVLRDALEELRLIRMKDTDAVYDPTLRTRIDIVLARAKEKE